MLASRNGYGRSGAHLRF